MKKLLLAAGVLGAMTLTAAPASAQPYHRGGTSFSVTIGSGYGYAPYGYGYAPYAYGAYPVAYGYSYYPPAPYYSTYYSNNWRRHHRHYRNHYRYYRY